ncbi:MAG: ribosome small subunit-dependent GTPase A [Desulfuromusa sp.]|nr:ribosome small subunit-dependent GTPase A [Desulfuromusa sp.]
MTLEDWGWSPFFAEKFKPWKKSGYLPARVIRGEKNYFRVWSLQGKMTVRFTGKIRHKAGGRADLPVVGDWVVVEPLPNSRGTIHALLERKSSFSRNLPGTRKGKDRIEQQVIAANVDLVFIVSGLDRDFNLRRIERYLTLVSSSGADAVILLNKTDLCENPEDCKAQVEAIAGNSPVHLCMAQDARQLDILFDYMQPGKTIALLGSSGVGKSTILNGMLGEERQKIAAVSLSDGKGRHTTTHRELILFPNGGILMDNPGMRELNLWGGTEDLAESFADIEKLAVNCKFRDCQHKTEPSCAVTAAIEAGDLSSERLSSYHKLKDELSNLQQRR